jgi:hypothetical protein
MIAERIHDIVCDLGVGSFRVEPDLDLIDHGADAVHSFGSLFSFVLRPEARYDTILGTTPFNVTMPSLTATAISQSASLGSHCNSNITSLRMASSVLFVTSAKAAMICDTCK